MDILVTPGGQMVDALEPMLARLARMFGDADPGAGRHLRLSWNERNARIRLSPDGLTGPCYRQLIELLAKLERPSVTIEHAAERLPAEVFCNFEDLVARLDDLRGATPGERPRPDYLVHPLSLARLRDPKRQPLGRLLRRWRSAEGRLGPRRTPTMPDASGHGLLDYGPRWLTVRVWPADPEIVSATIASLRQEGEGERYDRLVEGWQARLELVDLCLPAGTDRPARRLRYERLLLPWRTEAGGILVSSTALKRTLRPRPGPL